MKLTHYLAQIDANGCSELPFVQTASQTYFNYLNGSSGYIVFLLGGGLLILAMVNRKKLSQMPGWIGGIVIAALALGALPALLPAFGIDLGCGGAGTGGVVTETPAEETPEPAATPAGEN